MWQNFEKNTALSKLTIMQWAELYTRSALLTCAGEIIQVRRNNTRAP